MLRTLAINSNKKCVKFWCFDSFLITKANLRLRRVLWNPCKEYTRTERPDTPSEGIRTTYQGRNCTRLPPSCTPLPPSCTQLPPSCTRLPPSCTRMPPFYTRLLPFTPGCAPPCCTRLPPFAPRCRALSTPDVYIRNSDVKWERRTFRAPTFYIRISYSRMEEEDALTSLDIHIWTF